MKVRTQKTLAKVNGCPQRATKKEANELNVSRYAEIIGSHDKATDVTNGRTVLTMRSTLEVSASMSLQGKALIFCVSGQIFSDTQIRKI